MKKNMRVYEGSKLIDVKSKTILDLGCRDKLLQQYISKNILYTGVDFEESENVISYNLENGIPLEDNSFDTVVALDVLEHLENIHFLLDEMKRVARNEIIIALPNLYYYRFRFKYLFGYSLGVKYDLYLEKKLDRHRWVTSYNNTVALIKSKFNKNKVTIALGKTSNIKIIEYFDKVLQLLSPNLGSHTVFFHIRMENNND